MISTGYTIVRVASLQYQAVMQALLAACPDVEHPTYDDLQQQLAAGSYVHTSGLSRAMRQLGNNAHELIGDFKALQHAWAREHGIAYRSDHWQTDIVLAQLRHLRPDVVYLQDIHSLPHEVRRRLKDEVPGLRLVVVFKGFPGAARELADVDLLLAGIPSMVREYRQAGCRAHLVYHGFDSGVLELVEQDAATRQHDLVFCGTSGYGYGCVHQARYWMLVDLLRSTPLQAFIDERDIGLEEPGDRAPWVRAKQAVWRAVRRLLQLAPSAALDRWSAAALPTRVRHLVSQAAELKRRAREMRDPRYPRRPLREVAPQRCHPPLFGADMYGLLRQARIVVNRHTDAAGGCVGNMRMFEVTGVGSCLLTDSGENMTDLFEPDREVVTYSSTEECIAKVRELLANESLRAEIAGAGQRRTLRDHTIERRAAMIDELIRKSLQRQSP